MPPSEGASQRSAVFRLGDFYELFYNDAILAARELQITLTARNKEKAWTFRCVACLTTLRGLHRKAGPARI